MSIVLLIPFLVAFLEASRDIFHSSRASIQASAIAKALFLGIFTFPVVLSVFLYQGFTNGFPEIKEGFYTIVLIHAVLLAVANVLYMRALALGPLSQTQPILALTTVFLVLTNPLMTDNVVGVWQWVGIVMIGLGIYGSQHAGKRNPEHSALRTFADPFITMMTQPGVRSKLGVAAIYSVTANLDQLAIQRASGPFYLVIDSLFVMFFLTCTLLYMNKKEPIAIKQHFSLLAIGGTINAVTVLFQVWALTLFTVPFVIAIKRLSIILTSLWSFGVRKDAYNHYRMAGILFAVSGVMIVLLLK